MFLPIPFILPSSPLIGRIRTWGPASSIALSLKNGNFINLIRSEFTFHARARAFIDTLVKYSRRYYPPDANIADAYRRYRDPIPFSPPPLRNPRVAASPRRDAKTETYNPRISGIVPGRCLIANNLFRENRNDRVFSASRSLRRSPRPSEFSSLAFSCLAMAGQVRATLSANTAYTRRDAARRGRLRDFFFYVFQCKRDRSTRGSR